MCVSAFAGGREMLNYSRRRVLPGAIVRERERERERERFDIHGPDGSGGRND